MSVLHVRAGSGVFVEQVERLWLSFVLLSLSPSVFVWEERGAASTIGEGLRPRHKTFGPHAPKPQHPSSVTSSTCALRISSQAEGQERILCTDYFLCVSHHHLPHFPSVWNLTFSKSTASCFPPSAYSLIRHRPGLAAPTSLIGLVLAGCL